MALFSGRYDAESISSLIAAIGGAKGNLGFGEFSIPSGMWELSTTILSNHQSLQIRGDGRPVFVRTGSTRTGVISGGIPTGGKMIQVQDSSAVQINNLVGSVITASQRSASTYKASAIPFASRPMIQRLSGFRTKQVEFSILPICRLRWAHSLL